MPANESIKRRVKALIEGRAGYGGFVCVAVRPVYPDTTVPPTETIFSTPEAAKAAAVLRKAGRPIPEERVLCAISTDFTAGAVEPAGWIVAEIR